MPLRRVASQAGIPHQTLFNWMKGTQPRWHAALPGDLQRLGIALGLGAAEIGQLLRLAGCVSRRSGLFTVEELNMESKYRIPKGWFVGGDKPEAYEVGVDPEVRYENQLCVTIKAGPEPDEFAGLMQTIKADAYQGKRLRFSAAVRTQEVENRAALFMRIGGADGNILAFDNMRQRYISGSTDWTHYAVVLDVAEAAVDITFGFILSLHGQAWMGDVKLETVGKDVPTTDIWEEIQAFLPANLGFEA